jgi:hypothetical protein
VDPLQQLVETLRLLAQTNDPNRVVLIEKAINEYLNDKAGIVRLSLQRLCDAIDRDIVWGKAKRAVPYGWRLCCLWLYG